MTKNLKILKKNWINFDQGFGDTPAYRMLFHIIIVDLYFIASKKNSHFLIYYTNILLYFQVN